jgi:hypothetical protein
MRENNNVAIWLFTAVRCRFESDDAVSDADSHLAVCKNAGQIAYRIALA